jgi:hypothetical protein
MIHRTRLTGTSEATFGKSASRLRNNALGVSYNNIKDQKFQIMALNINDII